MISLTKKEKRLCLFFLPFYFFIARYVISLAMIVVLKSLDIYLDEDLLNAWFNFFFDLTLTVVGIVCFKEYLKKSISKIKYEWKKLTRWALSNGFLIFYIANILLGVITVILNPGASSDNQEAVQLFANVAPLPMFFSVVIFAPILEELVFRVAIFQSLYDVSRLLAYFVSSVCFGSIHIIAGLMAGDLTQLLFLVPYGFLGAMFCYFYEKKDTIYVPMLIHMANNLIAFLSMIL